MRYAYGLCISSFIVLLNLCGCASMLAPADAGFGDVETVVEDRIGYELVWSRELRDGGIISPVVRDLLTDDLTADEAVQIALLNNRRLQAIYEDLGVSQADLIQAGLLENPVFEGSVKLHAGDDVLELGVVQDFLSVFTIPLRRARARADFKQAKNRVAGEVIGLAGQTRIAFYRHQAAQQELTLQEATLLAADASYDAAQRLFDAGNITELARANERALYEQAKIGVSTAELAAANTRETLNVLMGLYGKHTAWTADATLPDVPEEIVAHKNLERRAIQASLDLAAARWQVEAAGQTLGMARLESVIPELGAGVDSEREADGTWFAGPLLEAALPIFDWGQGSRRRAEGEARRAWNQYTALAIEIRSAVRTAHYRMCMTQQQALYYREVLIPLNERITRETQLQFNAMQLGVFQLLAAKQREITVKRGSIRAALNYWIAHTQVQQILNGHHVPAPGGMMNMTANATTGQAEGH
jgi:cobalt-zinc-cadmium efflux system outer membrane protein